MGSAGAKAMAVVRGEADIYLHTGGQYEWDNCAPAAVAAAAGLHVSRIDGSPIRYNNENPYLPDLMICRPELAYEALRLATAYRAEADASAHFAACGSGVLCLAYRTLSSRCPDTGLHSEDQSPSDPVPAPVPG